MKRNRSFIREFFVIVIVALFLALLFTAWLFAVLFGSDLYSTTREASQETTSSLSHSGVRAPRGSPFPDLTVSGLNLSADCRNEQLAPGTSRMGFLSVYPRALRPVKQYEAIRQASTLSADSKFSTHQDMDGRPAGSTSGLAATVSTGMGVSPVAPFAQS